MSQQLDITLEKLIEGRKWGACSQHLGALDPLRRATLLVDLAHERLLRKYNDIEEIRREVADDWAQTLHVMLFRFIGGSHNRTATERLAKIATCHIVMRENSSLRNIEALLLGTSGLLDIYADDDYTTYLRQEFDHLAVKYNIEPMLAGEWQLTGMYLNNHPTLRIAQIAACLHENMITMQSITACQTRKDVYKLFSGKASDYWATNFVPRSKNFEIGRRVGSFKSDIMGINLVVPMMYAYGRYSNSDRLIDRSLQLLERIPAENNRYIATWNSSNYSAKTAFDSQALLQLSKEYCERSRCAECPLARVLIYCSQTRNRKQEF